MPEESSDSWYPKKARLPKIMNILPPVLARPVFLTRPPKLSMPA